MERWKFTREFKLEAVSHTIVHVSFAPKADKRADLSLSPLCAKLRLGTRDFGERTLRNVEHWGQWIFAPENLMTLAHFSVYAAMNVLKSAGELANTV
jgi:hypothetical protein